MKYLNTFNNKFIAVIAGFFGVVYFVGELSLIATLWGIAWLFGAVFTWKKQTWAVMLLTILAIYTLTFDIIFEIPYFKERVNEISADFEIARSIMLTLAISVVALETFILSCVIYYGMIVLRQNVRKAT